MNEKQTVSQFIRENAFKLAAIIVSAVNLWFLVQLAPLEKHLALVDQRVSAIEGVEPITTKEFNEIISRLDRIEDKLDQHIAN